MKNSKTMAKKKTDGIKVYLKNVGMAATILHIAAILAILMSYGS